MGSEITVFRSADEDARDEAAEIVRMLGEAGIPATLLDDSAPGVPSGAYEVQVDEANRARAEEVVATFTPDEEAESEADPSHDLDMVTVFRADGTTAELEALSVQSVLEDNGLSAMVVGDSRYPVFGYQVRVAREQEQRAQEIIREALAAGPAAADEAERSTE